MNEIKRNKETLGNPIPTCSHNPHFLTAYSFCLVFLSFYFHTTRLLCKPFPQSHFAQIEKHIESTNEISAFAPHRMCCVVGTPLADKIVTNTKIM